MFEIDIPIYYSLGFIYPHRQKLLELKIRSENINYSFLMGTGKFFLYITGITVPRYEICFFSIFSNIFY